MVKEDTMIPISQEPKKVEVEVDKLEALIKKVEILERTVSEQRQIEAKRALEKEAHPEPTFKLKLWKGVPIIKRETCQHEYKRNPMTNEAIDLIHKVKLTLADGTITEPIDFEIMNTLHEETQLRQKEVRRVGLEEVWIAEWIDPDMQFKYGDLEISITSSNAVNA